MHTVIIGSGIAGMTLAETLLKLQPASRITVVTRETHGYYSRPMLSHGFSRDDVESKIILRTVAAIRDSGLEILDGTEVSALDPTRKTLNLHRADGTTRPLEYDKLVLATGSEALIPSPFRASADWAWVVNSLDDLIRLRRYRARLQTSGTTPRWAIIGGGLIGCEVAADLAKAGDRVELFHALPRLMERQLEEEDSARLLAALEAQGLVIHLGTAVTGLEKNGTSHIVRLADNSVEGFDGIIIACGFKPRIELAVQAGLATHHGIQVDAFLTTSHPDIHAIGDVAECADGALYAYVLPVRQQAVWLGQYLAGQTTAPWQPPAFKPRAKVHGFEAIHPYRLG